MKKTLLLYSSLLASLLCQGCAVSYYSEETSTLHVFGIGHVAMRVPEENGQTVYHQINNYGFSAGTTRNGAHLTVGYSRDAVLDIADDQSLCFEWPDTDLINVRVGRVFPVNPQEGCTHAE